MGKNLRNVPCSKAQKHEFRDLLNAVIPVITKYNPEQLHLNVMLNRLVEANTQVQSTWQRMGKQIETEKMNTLSNQQQRIIRSIVSQARSIKRTGIAALDQNINLVLPFVERQLAPCIDASAAKVASCLNEMFTVLESDSAIQDALGQLNLMLYFEELRTTQENILSLKDQRREGKLIQVGPKMKDVKPLAQEALTDLLTTIELATIEYPEVDYQPLIDELNLVLVAYSTMIKSRSTRNKENGQKESAKTVTLIPTAEAV